MVESGDAVCAQALGEGDERGDVLYLSAGAPREPARTLETVDCDEDGRVIGMVLLNVRWTLQRDGELRVTLPEHPAVAGRRELEAVLG